jgi:ArsR family transcriptional regulator
MAARRRAFPVWHGVLIVWNHGRSPSGATLLYHRHATFIVCGLDAFVSIDDSRNMKSKQALSAFGALSQETRLEVFRQLVRLAPDSIPAGDLAHDLDVPPSTLSSHLAILQRAGLVRSERQSRTILYSADLEGARELVEFLVKDCCRGQAERCDQLLKAALPSRCS